MYPFESQESWVGSGGSHAVRPLCPWRGFNRVPKYNPPSLLPWTHHFTAWRPRCGGSPGWRIGGQREFISEQRPKSAVLHVVKRGVVSSLDRLLYHHLHHTGENSMMAYINLQKHSPSLTVAHPTCYRSSHDAQNDLKRNPPGRRGQRSDTRTTGRCLGAGRV